MSKKKSQGFHTPFAGLAGVKLAPEPAPKARTRGPARSAAPEEKRARSDDEIFLEEMAGAVPLGQPAVTRRVGAPAPQARPTRKSDDAEVMAELADLCDGEGGFDIADGDEYIEGTAPGIDRRLLKRLRAGEYAVQAHVDLHGLTRDEARDKVTRFVAESRRAARRCVLIVHGRGHHSKDNIPVLKQAVKAWLERGQTAKSVLAFVTARPCDGGAGAVYVLLRR